MNIVSIHLGIKQKSLFDHLMEDAESLRMIARGIQAKEFKRRKSVQKTYVLSRKTLSSLDRASKSFNAPRDALVEYSIERLLPVIVKEKERHLKRKKVLADLAGHLQETMKLLNNTSALLGEDDPVYDRMETAVSAVESAYKDIDAFVEKGKVIENF